jgi:hypothetical protein
MHASDDASILLTVETDIGVMADESACGGA